MAAAKKNKTSLLLLAANRNINLFLLLLQNLVLLLEDAVLHGQRLLNFGNYDHLCEFISTFST